MAITSESVYPAKAASSSCCPKKKKRRREGKNNAFLQCALFCAYIFSPVHNNEMSTRSCSLMKSPMTVSDAFMIRPLHINRNHHRDVHRQQRHCVIVQVATNPNVSDAVTTTTTMTPERSTLEKMTVKELKTFMQDNNILIPRGEASNLKLKKQIVDYIWNFICNNDGLSTLITSSLSSDDEPTVASTSDEPPPNINTNNTKKKKRPIGTGMPPLPETSTSNNDDSDNDSPYVLTPKDRIVLEVLDRYPHYMMRLLRPVPSMGGNYPRE